MVDGLNDYYERERKAYEDNGSFASGASGADPFSYHEQGNTPTASSPDPRYPTAEDRLASATELRMLGITVVEE